VKNPIAWLRRRRNCMHHDWAAGDSWIKSHLINTGMGKLFWCTRCNRIWTA